MYKVKFKEDKKRNLFFNSLRKSFDNWNDISKYLNINRNTLLDYRTGKNLIPYNTLKILNKYTKIRDIEKEIILRDINWGQKLGGKVTSQKHKWIFDLGRKKASSNRTKRNKEILNLNANSPELAEFIGILIGDGFLGVYGRNKMIQITGNKINDRVYYKKFLIPLIKNLFNINPNFYERKDCIRLTIYSKILLNSINKLFNFPIGKKGEISIPFNLIKTNKCKIALIRGLFDTDGTIYLERKKYPIISITTTSKILSSQIFTLFNDFGFGAYLCKSKTKKKVAYKINIFGKEKVLKWKNLIGSSNPYKLSRINASVAQR